MKWKRLLRDSFDDALTGYLEKTRQEIIDTMGVPWSLVGNPYAPFTEYGHTSRQDSPWRDCGRLYCNCS